MWAILSTCGGGGFPTSDSTCCSRTLRFNFKGVSPSLVSGTLCSNPRPLLVPTPKPPEAHPFASAVQRALDSPVSSEARLQQGPRHSLSAATSTATHAHIHTCVHAGALSAAFPL